MNEADKLRMDAWSKKLIEDSRLDDVFMFGKDFLLDYLIGKQIPSRKKKNKIVKWFSASFNWIKSLRIVDIRDYHRWDECY